MLFEEITGISKVINVLDLGARRYSNSPPQYEQLSLIKTCGVDYFSTKEIFAEHSRYYDHVINAIIGDGTPKLLYITQTESCTSLYEPNFRLLNHFQHLCEWASIKEKILVNTKQLNNIELPYQPDFIKSDLQGADYLAIKYGSKYFDKALVLEIEVDFLPQYKKQPLFSDIEMLLRKKGFMFHTFTGYGSRFFYPAKNPSDPYDTLNQWMWSHAVFVKNFIETKMCNEDYIKIGLIVHNVYQSYDLACHCLFKAGLDETCYRQFFRETVKNEAD